MSKAQASVPPFRGDALASSRKELRDQKNGAKSTMEGSTKDGMLKLGFRTV